MEKLEFTVSVDLSKIDTLMTRPAKLNWLMEQIADRLKRMTQMSSITTLPINHGVHLDIIGWVVTHNVISLRDTLMVERFNLLRQLTKLDNQIVELNSPLIEEIESIE